MTGRKLKAGICTLAVLALIHPGLTLLSAEEASGVEMYRLYNRNSGEHFYTADTQERDQLVIYGWIFEGVGWQAPSVSDTPVYRLYNSIGGEHHYTADQKERDALIQYGWTDEGIGWYSDDAKTVPVFREYNPNALSCNHNYTKSWKEHSTLQKAGWNGEGTGWYGVAEVTGLHHYDYGSGNITVWSAFEDREVTDEDGMMTDALVYAASDKTSVDLNLYAETAYDEKNNYTPDDLMKLASDIKQKDQENTSYYTLDYFHVEDIGDSYVRITRETTYPANEYYEGIRQFEVIGLFVRNGSVYELRYSCEAKNREVFEYQFNYCLHRSLSELQ